MPQVIPIKDLKNASDISELCHNINEPIYVTKNGYNDMVCMSVELFETMQKKSEIYAEIELSEMQIRHGKTKDAHKALEDIRMKYGL